MHEWLFLGQGGGGQALLEEGTAHDVVCNSIRNHTNKSSAQTARRHPPPLHSRILINVDNSRSPVRQAKGSNHLNTLPGQLHVSQGPYHVQGEVFMGNCVQNSVGRESNSRPSRGGVNCCHFLGHLDQSCILDKRRYNIIPVGWGGLHTEGMTA